MTSQQPASPDVIVVGAGSAGCALAAGLVERGRRVLLFEAGPLATAPPLWSLAGATDPSMSIGDRVAVAGGRTIETRRGALIGGSGAVNGGYFLHSRAADHRRLEQAGGRAWSDEALRAVYRRLPIRTWTDEELDPVSEAFLDAAHAAGFAWRGDLNGSVDDGVGLVPFSARDGERVTPASACLSPLDGHPGLDVRARTRATRVVIDDGRVRGVELGDGRDPIEAPTVVLSAGAVGSAELLLRSGVGPAPQLDARSVELRHELAGVGVRAANHPCIELMYLPRTGARGERPASFMQSVLHVDDEDWGGIVEVLPTRRPYGVVTGSDPGDRLLSFRVTLMSSAGRGTVALGVAEQLDLESGDLSNSGDLARLVRAVRRVTQLVAHSSVAGCVEQWHGPDDAVLSDEAALGAWVLDRVGTAYHLSGTAPMGPSDDAGSVVDGSLQVHGVDGLHVVDTSILPVPLSRGPAAAAMMIGGRAVDLID